MYLGTMAENKTWRLKTLNIRLKYLDFFEMAVLKALPRRHEDTQLLLPKGWVGDFEARKSKHKA
jgi:hypothetical protein